MRNNDSCITSHTSQEPRPQNSESQKKVSKGRPKTPPKPRSVVTDPQVSREAIYAHALNQMLFKLNFVHAGPHTWWNRINQQLWAFRVPWSPSFAFLCWSLKRSVKRTWTGSAFSTNESAWSVVVMGWQSHVWSGPKSATPLSAQ